MVANPFVGVIKMKAQDGWTISYPVTISDVNGEYYVFPDLNNDTVIPSNHGVMAIVDIVLSETGTDTSVADLYVNGKFTGERILNAANQGTNFSRQYTASTPLFIAAGSRIRFKQVT